MMVDNITIVGGGSAGWMTATTLLHQFPDKKITLIESPNTPNIGVGESTVAGSQSGFTGISDWLRLVDITDIDFMPHCDAIYKLSIAFENWYRKDSGTFHYPFGKAILQLAHSDTGQAHNVSLNDWHLKKLLYPQTPVSDYAESFFPAMALVNQNKSHRTDLRKDEINNEVQRSSGYSYQFDATKFGIWLRDGYCKTRYADRFTHIQAEVKEIPLDEDGIKHLVLGNGQKLEADLFIDCTGFKSLLLTKAFEVDFIPIEDFIPNTHAWATKIPYTDKETQIVNYTNCTAIENGWIWEIPLWSRMGSGYVFSDKFISTQAALREFKQGLRKKGYENVEDLEYHLIPMRSGVQSKLWVKNTCAIGLAAGFIEPLQSNGLHSIHQFIFNLLRILSRGHVSEWDRREFTSKCHADFYSLAASVAVSYALSHRDDTEYWKDIQNREYPADLFSYYPKGISKYFEDPLDSKNFSYNFPPLNTIVHCMTTGMNWNPIDIHSMEYDSTLFKGMGGMKNIKEPIDINIQQLENRKNKWNDQIKDFPSPYQYLKDNIHKSKR